MKKPAAFLSILILLALISFLDTVTGSEIAASIFYLIPILIAGLTFTPAISFSVVLFSAILWMFSDRWSGQIYSHPIIPFWNMMVRLGFFLIISMLVLRLKEEFSKLRKINDDLATANQKILKLAQTKSDFISTVSHELRTPLTAIKESLGILHDRSAGPLNEDQDDFIQTAVRNVDRLKLLIDDVLDIQKMEAGRMNLEMSAVDLSKLIREEVQSFMPLADRKHLLLVTNLTDEPLYAAADENRVRQVLNNLISNAIKFSEKGEIGIKACKKEDRIYVEISDQGIGIPPKDIPLLFQPFSQIASSHKRKIEGTGLGLAISKKLIEAMGGSISVRSVLKQGSIFYFDLKEAKS